MAASPITDHAGALLLRGGAGPSSPMVGTGPMLGMMGCGQWGG